MWKHQAAPHCTNNAHIYSRILLISMCVCVCGAVGKVNELFTPQTPSQITSSILTLSPVQMDNKKKHLKEAVELKHRGGDPGFHKQDVFFKIKMSTCTQHSSGFYQILSAKFPAFLQNRLFYFNSVSPTMFLGIADLYVIMRQISSSGNQLELYYSFRPSNWCKKHLIIITMFSNHDSQQLQIPTLTLYTTIMGPCSSVNLNHVLLSLISQHLYDAVKEDGDTCTSRDSDVNHFLLLLFLLSFFPLCVFLSPSLPLPFFVLVLLHFFSTVSLICDAVLPSD